MRLIEATREMSQRDVARELGISLDRVNYYLKALVKKGWVKVVNFKNSQNKAAYTVPYSLFADVSRETSRSHQ
jgi:predicted transcriptional regulator